jgi:hypothetical protein
MADEFNFLINESKFRDALPGHLDDPDREPIIFDRLDSIARWAAK